jgi:hypothetical protein
MQTYKQTNKEFKNNFYPLLPWKLNMEMNYHRNLIPSVTERENESEFEELQTLHLHFGSFFGFVISPSQFRSGFD